MSIRYLSGINVDANTLFVDSTNDRVGIGTASPEGSLHIYQPSGAGPFIISRTNNITGVNLQITTDSTKVRITGYGDAITFFTAASGSGTNAGEKMRITSAGNVGIGTTSPGAKLDIAGSQRIIHESNVSGLEVYTVGSAVATVPQVRIGRDSAQYLGFLVDDGTARIVHRQDEIGAGSHYFDYEIWSNITNKIYQWKLADNTGAGQSTLMVLNSTGLGIGTTNPLYPLDVQSGGAGTVLRAGTSFISIDPAGSASAPSLIFNGDDNTGIWRPAADTLAVSTAGAERLRITSAGNVGIGTTSPGRKLHVDNASGVGEAVISGTTGATLYFRPNASYSVAGNFGIFTTGLTSGTYESTMTIKGYSSAVTDVMTIKGSGNVGIGTTSPQANLNVYSADTAQIRIDAYTDDALLTLDSGKDGSTETSYVYFKDNNVNKWLIGKDTGNDFLIYDTTVSQAKLEIKDSGDMYLMQSGGNVGIGTTTPGTKLHIGTGSGATVDTGYQLAVDSAGIAGIQILAATNQSSRIVFGDSDDNDVGMLRYDHTDNSMRFITNGSSNERMRIDASGNVGIGTTSPSYPFTVSASTTEPIAYFGLAPSNASSRNSLVILQSGTIPQSGSDTTGEAGFLFKHSYGTGGVNGTANGGYIESIRESVFGITSQVNTALVFGTSASNTDNERMRITSGGNVGIGTTNTDPLSLSRERNLAIVTTGTNAALTIVGGAAGRIDFGVGSTRTGGIYSDSSNYTEIFTTTALPLVFSTNSAEKMRIAAGGNVLIGTTSDSGYKLDVNGTGRFSNSLLVTTSAAGSLTAKIRNTVTSASGNTGYGLAIESEASGATSYALTVRNLAESTTYFHISTATGSVGNVGIGTTSPAAKLDVQTSSTNLGLRLGNINGTNWDFYSYNDSNLYINNTGGTVFTILNSNGNVGINDATPSQKLHVSGNIRVTGAYYDSNNEAGTSGQVLSSTGSGTDWVSLSEITGVDGTGTANYVSKWSDADTITDSTITDDGTTVTAGVERFKILYQAGIYSFSDTVDASTSEDIFSISNTNGAQAFRVTFVCSTGAFSVAKTYEVVHSYGNTPIAFKVVDSGPYSGNDFDVAFTDAVSNTGIKCAITNNSTTVNANIVTTIFLGGSPTTITVTEH